ncbi:MAG: WecB/TagA/CpsF family glycosyltransferase, partial [Pseudomonadota bacterium]
GISLACRMIGERLQANLNGTDLLPELCELAEVENFTLYLLGAAPGVASRMQENLSQTYPGLKVVGEHHGYFDHDTESAAVIEKINSVKPNIVLVAFGAPMQEKWIHQHHQLIDSNVLIGVGGLFDFYSGDKRRAPLWMRKSGIEWMYRLYLEPGRLWRRYIIGNPLFLLRIMRWKKNLPQP